jgi:hypothetical protein
MSETALTPEEQFARFQRNADRYRAGLPHALTPAEVELVDQAREDADALSESLAWDSGPDTTRAWFRRIGFRRPEWWRRERGLD